MISTISKIGSFLELWLLKRGGILFFSLFLSILAASCYDTPSQPVAGAPGRTTKVSTVSPQTETQEPTKPSPQSAAAPAETKQEQEPPYYGSTYWNEVLTSVYYYPNGGADKPNLPMTHLKFNHQEEEIWICGDQRKSIKPGRRIQLMVTFEANQPCATNWNIE